jgi:hypothetical protein
MDQFLDQHHSHQDLGQKLWQKWTLYMRMVQQHMMDQFYNQHHSHQDLGQKLWQEWTLFMGTFLRHLMDQFHDQHHSHQDLGRKLWQKWTVYFLANTLQTRLKMVGLLVLLTISHLKLFLLQTGKQQMTY